MSTRRRTYQVGPPEWKIEKLMVMIPFELIDLFEGADCVVWREERDGTITVSAFDTP